MWPAKHNIIKWNEHKQFGALVPLALSSLAEGQQMKVRFSSLLNHVCENQRARKKERATQTENTRQNVRHCVVFCQSTTSTLQSQRVERSAFVCAVQGLSWNSIPFQILLQAAISHRVQCGDAASEAWWSRSSKPPQNLLQQSPTSASTYTLIFIESQTPLETIVLNQDMNTFLYLRHDRVGQEESYNDKFINV